MAYGVSFANKALITHLLSTKSVRALSDLTCVHYLCKEFLLHMTSIFDMLIKCSNVLFIFIEMEILTGFLQVL